ncbi:disease resistance protein RGA2-like isoform X1 [Ananas comosus]|uniref:Disease resistance protein RGA2-like isoform X1 n=1 Tax=Ananas comosus TaxID=4615 RepID=A0A6P5FWC1_ANACO|nr:disease resistance protein RGA2-like isoform X1 [Ananas comosus]XP_020099963.1 disease resistance protein RGA2-like isoform X1 [Ananas comosus]XP_020099964.1 disease resistance protein RGA2-like isoform X1 [Ananas comosus]XP_020099965.1 disease resistance protein RGA2-like isoform X1 [Ananas comosus]XP_020099966.1 disease resistance protein RGA2-like isoform X1 [Ananas comosus]XP_020099967.1 disease resistance protein RGA2-like isoform X1 [Ananas comosus]XP_020099968.1 disease resistance p
MALQDVAAVLEVPVVPEVAAVLERTRQRLSSEVVTEFVSRAGFGAELDRLIGRLTEIYLAVPTAGLPDRAERYWHKEIEDACCFSDRFVDLVREYPHGSLDDGIRLMEEDYDVGCGLKTLLRIFGNLLKRLEFFAAESEILGRDENKEIIFQIILSVVRISNSDHLRLVHISGSEGSGKTALARLVYNDPRVKKYFDCRMWVAVPEDFDVELIVMKIIKCAIRSANRMLDLGSVDKLYDNLRQVLHGRKFFLVLDDVLSVNYDGWELLRSLLSVGEEGSTIITTVNWEEGTNTMIAESGVPYMLEPLPEDVCFDLLVKKAFGTETKVDFRAFSAIGKKIVGKCRGLPLAINMIGEMLRCNPEIPNHLLDYLDSLHTFTKFSYQTLPLHLQWCITYLTLFPYDYAFDKHKVVELWNAEGFISCAHQDDIIEDYSGHFFDILVSYSFLQAVQYPYDQVRYHVNRYLYFHAQALSTENFVQYPSRPFARPKTIRLSSLLCDEDTRTFPSDLSQCHNLRTLLLVKNSKMDELKKKIQITRINDDLFTHLANLCLLDLNSCAISELPKSIKRLSCLRYLNLSETDIETIPESIGNLWELQILNLSSCKNFHTIPESIGGLQKMLILNLSHCRELCTLHPSITKLRNLETLNLEGCCKLDSLPESMYSLRELRHLNILGCSSLTTMPRRMGWLSRLQTLSRFIVTAERGRKIEELGSLDNLKGALQIENLEKALDPEDAKRAQLNSKRNITSLALYWSWLNFYNDDNEASDSTVQQVLEALQPPPSLEILDIFSYPGTGAPQWMTNGKSTLKSMVEIRLVNLKRLESLPPLGQFPCLKVIEIRGMNAMTCVDDTFSGNDGMFPKLEKLTFSQMPNLEKWVMEDNQDKFPRLSNLTIAHCPKLKVLHFSCSSLKNLTLLFNNEMLYSTPGALKYFGRSLQKLTIGLCYELVATSTCEALRDLTALKELEISECDELISLPHCMRYLTSLRYMTIMNCRNLKTLPYWLTRSRSRPELLISGCPKLLHQT